MPVGQLSIRADHDSRPLVVLDCFGDVGSHEALAVKSPRTSRSKRVSTS
jgi:hypothetical protein